MATATFCMRNGEFAKLNSPNTSKSELQSQVEAAMRGPNPTVTLQPVAGGPTILVVKAKVKNIIYSD